MLSVREGVVRIDPSSEITTQRENKTIEYKFYDLQNKMRKKYAKGENRKIPWVNIEVALLITFETSFLPLDVLTALIHPRVSYRVPPTSLLSR